MFLIVSIFLLGHLAELAGVMYKEVFFEIRQNMIPVIIALALIPIALAIKNKKLKYALLICSMLVALLSFFV